jgi:endonuclease YncB( thermonuclease family)
MRGGPAQCTVATGLGTNRDTLRPRDTLRLRPCTARTATNSKEDAMTEQDVPAARPPLSRRIAGILLNVVWMVIGSFTIHFVSTHTSTPDNPVAIVETEQGPELSRLAPVYTSNGLGLTAKGQVVSVRDGDTLQVEFRVRLNVRLLDCWAPELNTAEGKRSAANLKAIATPGKECVMTMPFDQIKTLGDITSMGRFLAWVSVDGQDLSQCQVKAGCAKKVKE